MKSLRSSEKFCLRWKFQWNDFELNIGNALHELKEEKDFTDVTLVCSDSQVEAHKVILAASSPFFKRILKKNPHSHPLIYLKGIKSSDVEAVLNYIYQGEVNVEKANLKTFLEVAEDLEVKGLVPGNNMQSPFPRTNMQSPASKITKGKQTSDPRCNSQTLQEFSPSVNNNTSEVVQVKVEAEDTFSAPALEEEQQENDLGSLNHQLEQCSQILLSITRRG